MVLRGGKGACMDLKHYLIEMCSGSEAGSYSRLVDFVYHSTLGLRVIKKKNTHTRRLGGSQGGILLHGMPQTLHPKISTRV